MTPTTTITATLTYPTANMEEFAVLLGYQEMVANPDYVPAVLDADLNEVAPAVGEPTIPNPESKVDFAKRKFKEHSVAYFTQFAERDAEKAAKVAAQEQIATLKASVESALVIT